MIVEVHRHNYSPMWFYNCRKNKPNKLKKPFRALYFFLSGYFIKYLNCIFKQQVRSN
jgi:hypothetical protein